MRQNARSMSLPIRTVCATRYVTPLREGGSLPAIVEADDDGLYVLKFRGAGQGPKALIAELVAGEIGRALGLPVPEIVFIDLDPELARTEPDPEIQELIRASGGLNLALDYLPGSVTFDPLSDRPDPGLASRIVWFDGFVTNLDRTPRNANLLMWHRSLRLIDHGASLYFQHQWGDPAEMAVKPFALIKDHVLLPFASALDEADATLPALLPRAPPDHRRHHPRGLAAPRLAVPRCRRAPRGLRPVFPAPARRAARLRRGGTPCPRPCTRMTTPSCGWCRASSGASSSTRA